MRSKITDFFETKKGNENENFQQPISDNSNELSSTTEFLLLYQLTNATALSSDTGKVTMVIEVSISAGDTPR